MTQQEYQSAIKKQQSLIRKLFTSRKRRSETIDVLTQERYRHLVGRFFRPKGDRFRSSAHDIDYYIHDVYAESNYVMSDEVHVELDCRYISRTLTGADLVNGIVGIDVCNQTFRFNPEDDIDEILAPMWVDSEKAIKTIDDDYKKMRNRFLKTKQKED